jgi:hypothetical protein
MNTAQITFDNPLSDITHWNGYKCLHFRRL